MALAKNILVNLIQIVAHFALFMTMLKMLLAGKKFIIVPGMKMVH